jgi:hypothetical protein
MSQLDKLNQIKSLLEQVSNLNNEVSKDFKGYKLMMGSLELTTSQALLAVNDIINDIKK